MGALRHCRQIDRALASRPTRSPVRTATTAVAAPTVASPCSSKNSTSRSRPKNWDRPGQSLQAVLAVHELIGLILLG